jgi:hypothetical protein
MSIADKLKSRAAEMVQQAKELIVDDELAKKRMEICKACPHFISLTTQCKKCGCIMAAKTKLKNATCPIGKW